MNLHIHCILYRLGNTLQPAEGRSSMNNAHFIENSQLCSFDGGRGDKQSVWVYAAVSPYSTKSQFSEATLSVKRRLLLIHVWLCWNIKKTCFFFLSCWQLYISEYLSKQHFDEFYGSRKSWQMADMLDNWKICRPRHLVYCWSSSMPRFSF